MTEWFKMPMHNRDKNMARNKSHGIVVPEPRIKVEELPTWKTTIEVLPGVTITQERTITKEALKPEPLKPLQFDVFKKLTFKQIALMKIKAQKEGK